MDEASNSLDSREGLILTNLEGIVIEYALWFIFEVSNNQAEYEILLAGLRIVKELIVKKLRTFTDF